MKILIINPNSTSSMTQTIADVAKQAAGPNTNITAINPSDSPPSIQGPEDGDRALPHLIKLFEKEVIQKTLYDAVVIACFDDTGLWQLRAKSPVPVIGIGEAAFKAAMLVSERFSIVTTLDVSVPVIENNLRQYGYRNRCSKVRASDIPVLALEGAADNVTLKLETEIANAFDKDKCGAVVLGCAGMAEFAQRMTERFCMPVIDGVVASVGLCEVLYKLPKPNRSIENENTA